MPLSLLSIMLLSTFSVCESCLGTRIPDGFTIPPGFTIPTTLPPTTIPAGPNERCVVPDGTLGITFDQAGFDPNGDGVGLTRPPVARCTSCETGQRYFFEPTDQTTMDDAGANGQQAARITCDDWSTACMCSSANDCCTFQGTDVDVVNMAVWCDTNNNCQQYLSIQGTATLDCPSGDTFTLNGADTFGTANSYFQVNAFSCNSCDGIRMDPCMGPTVPISS